MILRRFMKHITDQNWLAVGLDVIVVITGIFLGMQVTDWNEERKNNAEISTIISQLHNDAETSHQLAHQQQESIKSRRISLEYILSYDESQKDISHLRDNINTGLFDLSQLESQFTTFEALKESGWLAKLGRPDIITLLNEIITLTRYTRRTEEDTERFQHGITDRFAMKNLNLGVIFGSGVPSQAQKICPSWPDVFCKTTSKSKKSFFHFLISSSRNAIAIKFL